MVNKKVNNVHNKDISVTIYNDAQNSTYAIVNAKLQITFAILQNRFSEAF